MVSWYFVLHDVSLFESPTVGVTSKPGLRYQRAAKSLVSSCLRLCSSNKIWEGTAEGGLVKEIAKMPPKSVEFRFAGCTWQLAHTAALVLFFRVLDECGGVGEGGSGVGLSPTCGSDAVLVMHSILSSVVSVDSPVIEVADSKVLHLSQSYVIFLFLFPPPMSG